MLHGAKPILISSDESEGVPNASPDIYFLSSQQRPRPLHTGDDKKNTSGGRVFSCRNVPIFLYRLLAALMVALPLGCSENAKQDRIDRIAEVIQCNAKDVQEVVLLPLESRVSLVERPIAIKDGAAIDAICKALNSASKFLPNHPSTKWEVKVEIRTRKTKVSFVVFHTEHDENGTVVSILSNVTWGWNYGHFRCDSLGPLLAKLAKQQK